MSIRVKDWKRFQHFKDRRPIWIKLYCELLNDPEWHQLDIKLVRPLINIWIVASEDPKKEGMLPPNDKLAFRLRVSQKELESSIIPGLYHWLTQGDINPISERYQEISPELDLDLRGRSKILETEKEKPIAPNDEKPIVAVPKLSWDRKFIGITPEMTEAWSKAYPACDIAQHLYRMDQWLLSNPAKSKKKNYYRFITNWLSKSQEKGGR